MGQNCHLTGRPVFLFGRYSRCHFRLSSDPAASQLHFLVDISDGRVRIIDLGSTNGIVVNDVPYGGRFGKPAASFLVLNNGDSVLAGGSVFQLEIDYSQEDAPADIPQGQKSKAEIVAGVPDRRQESKIAGEDEKDRTAIGHAPQLTAAEINERFPEVDGYVMLGRIGSGGRGTIYKAIKIDSGEKAALKMLLPKTLKKPRALEVFDREIKITRELNHPNIIRHIDDGVSNHSPYLAIEYADGGNLDEYIRLSPEGRLDFSEAASMFTQVLEGLSYMHDKALVHKDVKPKNVLLVKNRETGLAAKLSDMGLTSRMSTNMGDDFLPLVAEGGTPAYMPPEQLIEFTQALPQSDVFSAAATFYQMLTGSLLYDFKNHDQATAILDGNIRPILTLCPELPGRVAEVVNRALSYYPENRYADAGEMLAALKEAL
jgi:tRNA A-37 threonylcarbamoyl transferase component Bud32/pSer/pThr/pTyr-binding forkhead associated (FHA) protein